MNTIKIPKVLPIRNGAFVTIPSESWNTLCNTLNDIAQVINAQSEVLTTHDSKIYACESNIIKVAKILEDVYENFE